MFFRVFLAGLLCFAGASLSHPILSKDRTAKIIQKSDFVFEVQKKFPLVLTSENVKSKDGVCSIKIDLMNGLISTGQCVINKADAYTKDLMWIGSLTYIGNGLSLITSFDSRTNYNHTWFGGVGVANPYDIWVVDVDFDEPTEIADSSNISAVSCSSGKKPIIVENEEKNGLFYWDCYAPWKCKKGEYSVNEQTCRVLPENAQRNSKEGFSCNKGFVPVKESCEEKRTCNENEHYDVFSNACWTLPQNAKWADSILSRNDFVCDSNFFKNVQYSTCDAKVTCENEQHYDAKTNRCWSLPQNASWMEVVSDSMDWECIKGYVKIQGVAGHICEKKKKCNSRDYYEKENNTCWILPQNAYWNADVFSEDDWSCNSDYEKKGNGCQKKIVCGNDEIQLNDGECEKIPDNSYKVDAKTWKCDTGYDRILDNNRAYCEERKSKTSSTIPTEWIATGTSVLLGLIVLLVSMNSGK